MSPPRSGGGAGRWLKRLLNPRPPATRRSSGMQTRTLANVQVEKPRPLSTQRVGDDLSRRGYRFRIDDDGDVTGTWDGNRFWFLLLGEHDEILQVRGRWAGALPAASRLAVLQAANDWNRERIWPKVYTREEERGARSVRRGVGGLRARRHRGPARPDRVVRAGHGQPVLLHGRVAGAAVGRRPGKPGRHRPK